MSELENAMELHPNVSMDVPLNVPTNERAEVQNPPQKQLEQHSWKDTLTSKKGLLWLAVIIAVIVAFYWYVNKDKMNIDLSFGYGQDYGMSPETPLSDIASSMNRQ